MKKFYASPDMELIRFALRADILGDSTEGKIPVIDVEIPDGPPDDWDDLFG